MNKKPPELHVVDGTIGRNPGVLLPDSIRSRIPVAEWLADPNAWDKTRFINETADYLFTVYGLGSDQDRHLLAMLAEQIDMYIDCSQHIAVEGLVCEQNGGKTIGANPYVSIREKALMRIVTIMNELGLTPRGRLAVNKSDATPLTGFLKGIPAVK